MERWYMDGGEAMYERVYSPPRPYLVLHTAVCRRAPAASSDLLGQIEQGTTVVALRE